MPSNEKTIVYRPLAELKPAARNTRTHRKKQIRQIADSIKRFGFVGSIIIDVDLRIVAGHACWEAAKISGIESVPTMIVDHLSKDELRAYAIAANRLASTAGWDKELLSLEFAELQLALPELDLTVTGFELDQIELLADLSGSKRREAPQALVPNPPSEPVTLRGDVWCIGGHKLLCGDSLEQASYLALLGSERADMIVADFPYNVPISGHVSSSGKHAEFAMASGDMSPQEFERFLSTTCRWLARFSRSGSLHYLFMDWRSITTVVVVGQAHFDALLNIIVWKKHVGGMGSLYRSQHELIALFKNGKRPHKNRIELGANGRTRTNIWEYPGVSGYGDDREISKLHPTVKNVDMVADAIRDVTDVGDIVLDPFGGAGTSLISAQRSGRRARLIEIDPGYCDVTLGRAIAEGLTPHLEVSGETFQEIKQKRLGKGQSGQAAA